MSEMNAHRFTEAIDIYIFSNGQEYSPPRKYHLCGEDLDLWKSTLGFMARTQYGALHSNIDLYTIDGKKVFGPLGLTHGASYVAVEPPDKFINSGYEKYLIRATRSQEKRQTKRSEGESGVEVSDAPGPNSELRDESLLQTIISSTVDHQSSVLVKPEPPKSIEERLHPMQMSTIRIERKRTSIPRPSISRKATPITAPPNPFIRPFYKSRDNIRGSNVKITGSESIKVPVTSISNHLNRVPAKSKISKPSMRPKETIPRQLSILAKVREEQSDLHRSCSGIKIPDHKQDKNLSANNINIKDIIEDKDLVKVSSNDNDTLLTDCMQYHPMKIVIETVLDDAIQDIHKNPIRCSQDINSNAITFLASHKNGINDINNNDSPKLGCLFPSNSDTEKRYEIVNLAKTVDGCSRKCPNNNLNPNSQEEIKMLKILDSPAVEPHKHSILIMTDNISDDRRESKYISPQQPAKESPNNNGTHSNDNVQSCLTSTEPDNTVDDQYVAVLKKGDVVNLNLNIEIKNRDRCCDKHKDNEVNLHSTTDILYTEKGSQINMNSHILLQNKSLVSLIKNEINSCNNLDDKHPVIIVQCGDCKYCKERNPLTLDKLPSQNYLILMPLDKFEEKFNGCQCEKSLPQSRNTSVFNPVKPSVSCTSLERLTKLRRIEGESYKASETITACLTDDKILVESKGSETGLKRKVYYGECSPAIQESSKIFQEINETSDLITCTSCTQDYCHGYKETQSNIQITLVDNFTQTDWCDVLLEARLLEDGHYSFRLPTLEMLKFYNLGS